jgi:hypothetical protein
MTYMPAVSGPHIKQSHITPGRFCCSLILFTLFLRGRPIYFYFLFFIFFKEKGGIINQAGAFTTHLCPNQVLANPGTGPGSYYFEFELTANSSRSPFRQWTLFPELGTWLTPSLQFSQTNRFLTTYRSTTFTTIQPPWYV